MAHLVAAGGPQRVFSGGHLVRITGQLVSPWRQRVGSGGHLVGSTGRLVQGQLRRVAGAAARPDVTPGAEGGSQSLAARQHEATDLVDRFDEALVELERAYDQDLGLSFVNPTFDVDIRRCANNCDFCFVKQNARGMRRSVYIKDDDYRYSFLFGNFVTLTNLTNDLGRQASLTPAIAIDGSGIVHVVFNGRGSSASRRNEPSCCRSC